MKEVMRKILSAPNLSPDSGSNKYNVSQLLNNRKMKKLIAVVLVGMLTGACATGGGLTTGGGGGQASSQVSSAESQARELTNRMKTVLSLDKTQEDKVLSINVVNQKLLQRIRENNDQSLAASAKENYHKELKAVLTADQFSKFRTSFPQL